MCFFMGFVAECGQPQCHINTRPGWDPAGDGGNPIKMVILGIGLLY